jgi:hypothetical protein
VIAFAALAAPQVASAKKKKVTVDATMTVAIIGQPEGGYELAGRITGKPFGTAGVVGETSLLTSTPAGLSTEGQSVVYAKKGTVTVKTTDVAEFQPDGSISLNGTFEVLRGSGKYKGAKGGGTFNGALPPGSTPAVGTVITFHLDGRARY